jgi:hypothetical protein
VRLRGAVVALVAFAVAGCVAPAPTTSAYEGKAARTAQDALSELETARLAVQASVQGRMPQAYLETMLSDAEDAFGSIQNTFDSVQPPDDPRADALRDTLDGLLSDGSDGLAALRVAARRQERTAMTATAAELVPVVTGLARFDEEHSG